MFKFIKKMLCVHNYEISFICNVTISQDNQQRSLVRKECSKCGKIKVTI